MSWVRVATIDEVPSGGLLSVQTDQGSVVLARVADGIYALEDRCSHQEYPLSDGLIEHHELECPYHGARFDVCTGRAVQLPAITPIRTFQVEVRDGDVYIRVG